MPKNRLEYGYGAPELSEDSFKISPSSFANFFSAGVHNWFRDQFLGEKQFLGNTGSVRGTLVHFYAECITKNHRFSDIDKAEAREYMLQCGLNEEEVDIDEIESTVDDMYDLVDNFIKSTSNAKSEFYLTCKLHNNVVLSGQVDYLVEENNSKTIGDYKTLSGKYLPKKINYSHKLQLMVYAYMYELQTKEKINNVEVTYIKAFEDGVISEKTGKKGKSYPADIVTFKEQFTEDDRTQIHGMVEVLKDTMLLFFEHPEYAYILFKDYRFKGTNFDVPTTEKQSKPGDDF
jgi:hypothetical protein